MNFAHEIGLKSIHITSKCGNKKNTLQTENKSVNSIVFCESLHCESKNSLH